MTVLNINSGDYVHSLGIGCSNGTILPQVGGLGGSNNKIISTKGFTNF